MTAMPRPICEVCRRPLAENDQYLVRFDTRGMTCVHRSLCFPPARPVEPKAAARAAA